MSSTTRRLSAGVAAVATAFSLGLTGTSLAAAHGSQAAAGPHAPVAAVQRGDKAPELSRTQRRPLDHGNGRRFHAHRATPRSTSCAAPYTYYGYWYIRCQYDVNYDWGWTRETHTLVWRNDLDYVPGWAYWKLYI